MLGHLGAISLKLPNFLITSQDVTKGADQATYAIANYQTELFPTTLTARQNPKSNKKKQDEMDEIDHF